MASNEYHFITQWRVQGTVKEVVDVLRDPTDLVRWWPSVYLDVRVLEPGEPSGLGKVVDLYTKGCLPYTLRWTFRVTEVRDDGFTLVASGDFHGRGIWTFLQKGEWVDIIYDWKIRAEKPLLRSLSWLMKPIFAANHRWAMAKGEESLTLELLRLHTQTTDEQSTLPAPPQATSISLFVGIVGAVAVVGIVAGCGYTVIKSISNVLAD